MRKIHFSTAVWMFCCFATLPAQVRGTVTDENGEPLSFATVYVNGTTNGTTSNIEGDYDLRIEPGSYEIVFQYVGYKRAIRQVEISGAAQTLDVSLQPESVGLSEVVVEADGEDPAYAIIRKAQAKRKYYLNQTERYTCKTYMKGNQQIYEVPERFMGTDLGDLGGILDTATRSGIVYLSESISVLHYERPNRYKEKMISSKVSGDDNGFSFNQASALDFNFYQNTYTEIGRGIVSPIADNAMDFYRYELEGAFVDESGQLVNKILVSRKRDTDPTIAGYLYINENLWNIHSVDMWTDGKAFAVPALDTFYVQQVNLPVEGDNWKIFSSNVQFKLKVFGIGFEGVFMAVFSDYDLDPPHDGKTFKGGVLEVDKEANGRDSAYWEDVRPIPLTMEEMSDYRKKDSLQLVWDSEEFLDSMDRKTNKFGFGDLLFGYTYSNRYKDWRLSLNSPVTTISFNTVQGYHPLLNGSFWKGLDDDKGRFVSVNTQFTYGFSDKQWRGRLAVDTRLNQREHTRLGFEMGRMASQFNEEEPIEPLVNTLFSLISRRNFAKLYDRYYLRLNASSELFNGFRLSGYVDYAHRKPLMNHSNHSWFYRKSREYTANDPLDAENFETPSFEEHEALTIGVRAHIRFKQKYLDYPNQKIILGSDYPEFSVEYRRGVPVLGGDSNYDFISLAVQDEFRMGMLGYSSFNLEGGAFLSDKEIPFVDAHHFNGRSGHLYFTNNILDQFRMLDYYKYSTTLPYVKLQWEHTFNGSILGRIPGVRKLQWDLRVGANFLYTDATGFYSEYIIGLDRLGIGLFRIFRLDFVTQVRELDKRPAFRMMLGVDL